MFLLLFLLFLAAPALAVVNPQTGSTTVTVTVPDRGRPDTPVLISPENNATIGTTAPTFIFNPSLGDRPVSHYQLWLDGLKNTDHIPQSFSTITTNALKALQEGQHTWMIKAIAANGSDRDSAIWSFSIDTTAPLILIQSVADQTASLSSLDLPSWPNEVQFSTNQRYPLITGLSEAGAYLTINFSGPSVTDAVNQIIGSDRRFSLKPKTALLPGRYQVTVAAADAAGNTTNLPSFTLTITSPTQFITLPLPSPLPNLNFTLPVKVPAALTELPTAFPLLTATPSAVNNLIWLALASYLCHIYCLNRFIHRLHLHHSIKNIHFIYIYITILLPTGIVGYLTWTSRHWLPLILTLLSGIGFIYELKLYQSKNIKIEQI
jgi:hypothetical protein